MPAATWLEQVASDLLETEKDLRIALRRLSHGHGQQVTTPSVSLGGPSVTITVREARTLLRAAMPLPVTSTRLREPHAHLASAMAQFSGHLLATHQQPNLRPATAAALALRDEIDRWLDVAKWQTACTAAHVHWHRADLDPDAIRPILRQRTGEAAEHTKNDLLTPTTTVTGLAAGVPDDAGTYIRAARRRQMA